VKEVINSIRQAFVHDLKICKHPSDLEALKVRYLGKKGLIQDQLKNLRDVPNEEKPLIGKLVNELKTEIEERLDSEIQSCQSMLLQEQISKETLDVTLPGKPGNIGSKHPVTEMLDEITDIFVSMGFTVALGPEIETEYYNFDVLNISPDHPARDMQDTFYVAPGMLLRTHTSNVQGRVMESTTPPIRTISPGRCFRNESIDARHHVFFHQVEGLYVDEGVSMQDLLATLSEFVRRLFKKDVKVRLRPSYFPFVEPGVELDMSCLLCQGKGCTTCKHTGWIEVLGAGMIHPQVLRNVGIDPEKYTGYAWGLGVERMVCLRSGIADIRLFSENDMRFLSQFYAV
jgi:phenylalanyl-tRNA synthetase alpha chain